MYACYIILLRTFYDLTQIHLSLRKSSLIVCLGTQETVHFKNGYKNIKSFLFLLVIISELLYMDFYHDMIADTDMNAYTDATNLFKIAHL